MHWQLANCWLPVRRKVLLRKCEKSTVLWANQFHAQLDDFLNIQITKMLIKIVKIALFFEPRSLFYIQKCFTINKSFQLINKEMQKHVIKSSLKNFDVWSWKKNKIGKKNLPCCWNMRSSRLSIGKSKL